MSPDERQMLTGLFQRVSSQGGSPRDRDAEALIADAVRAMPFAPYLLAQTVLVQEQALAAAATRLQELEAQVRDLQSHSAPADSGAGGFLGGLGKSLFGGSAPAAQPRPQQSYAPQQPSGPWGQPAPQAYQPAQQPYQPAPQYQQPMQQRGGGGGGFLTGALGAAAGVAGGVLMADSIKGLFGGHNNPLGGIAGGSAFGQHGDNQQAFADADSTQDALQDANDDNSAALAQEDTSADNASDTSDYGSGPDDSGSTDV